MKIATNFNELRRIVAMAAESVGVSLEELKNSWDISYHNDFDKEFKCRTYLFDRDINLLKAALKNDDNITIIVAIVRASGSALTISSIFYDIMLDIHHLGWGDELKDKWPKIPNNYNIPECYGYDFSEGSFKIDDKHIDSIMTITNFNKMREIITLAAESVGVSWKELNKNWDIDYQIDLDKEFKDSLSELDQIMILLKSALKNNDKVTAIVAITKASTYAKILVDFFEKITNDLERLIISEELKDKWPEIPDDYEIPECYGYERFDKPFKTYDEIVERIMTILEEKEKES